MKKTIAISAKKILQDRPLFLMCLAILLVAIIYVIYMSFSLNPVENQIATRYTAYGETNLYRNQWYYLITFIFFAVAMAAVHIGLIIKINDRGMRSLAIVFGVLSVVMYAILFLLTHSVLGNAYFL